MLLEFHQTQQLLSVETLLQSRHWVLVHLLLLGMSAFWQSCLHCGHLVLALALISLFLLKSKRILFQSQVKQGDSPYIYTPL